MTTRMDSLEEKRNRLVDSLLRREYIRSPLVENAMRRVPREEFLPEALRDEAYIDSPLPIGDGQTISAPHMVAIMAEQLDLAPGMKVLEIGSGSGYHAAVLAELAREGTIYTVERFEGLAEHARKLLPANVVPLVGDGSLGLPEHAPFDRILVTCSAPDIPSPLLAQLKAGGRMVIPLGKGLQELFLIRKNGVIEKEAHGAVAFVLLVGKYGFPDKHYD